jgi:hypothetical protein
MLSYKQWKSLNESALSSFNLGLSAPNNLGIVSQFGFEETKHEKKKKKKMPTGDGEIVDPSSKKDEPKKSGDVDVEVEKGEDSKKSDKPGLCGECGKLCGVKAKSWAKKCMMCGKGMCGMMSKKKMDADESDWSDEDDADNKDEEKVKKNDEDHDEDHDEDAEEGDEDKKADDKKKPFCMKSKKKMFSDEGPNTPEDIAKHEKGEDEGEDEDHEEEGEEHDHDHDEEEGDEDHDHEEGDEDHDHEEGDEDHEEEPEVSKPMMSKKKMLKGGQHKLDMNKDGKIDGEDFKLMHAKKKAEKKAGKKAGKKDESAEEAWWNSVRSMLGTDPSQKFSDGLFTPLDTDNLYQAVRSED